MDGSYLCLYIILRIWFTYLRTSSSTYDKDKNTLTHPFEIGICMSQYWVTTTRAWNNQDQGTCDDGQAEEK